MIRVTVSEPRHRRQLTRQFDSLVEATAAGASK
jgi:hypothetical protein